MKIQLTINGQAIKVNPQHNLLEVIQQQGIPLPSLCHLPGHAKRSVCRLCMIEIKGNPNPVSACSTSILDGMVIYTETALLKRLRKSLIKMALLEHGHCGDKHCYIENLARTLNIEVPVHTLSAPLSLEQDLFSEYLEINPNHCIHCDRCIRACHKNIINRTGRGSQTSFAFGQNQNLDEAGCIYCGDCARVCLSNTLKVST